ncbi:MAG TPA: hypothetical protein VFU82_00070 [Gammaproteobacteria bacterium]|jgi:hypothetical protein|nr:hypothetical protein [Gammaproteobacteria bacterium]
MPGNTQGSTKTITNTQDIMKTLNTPLTTEPLLVHVLRKNASKKMNAPQHTRTPLDKKAVHGLLSRLKNPPPSTDAQAFDNETPNQSKRPRQSS